MHKFAHMADVHLGAHREPALKELELSAFAQAMDRCMSASVDFILISGDLFHVGIPDLGVVNSALAKMMEVKRAGIPIYVIYGSHDYTPTGTSVIDILETAGAITNLSKWTVKDGKLKVLVRTDEKTGAKLAGISARKVGLESKNYELLDRKSLEAEDGFKVFAFHSGITEYKPEHLSEMETIGLSALPSGFDYYAGGHIHQRGEFSEAGYAKVVFPGPLFTGYGKDVEETVRGEKRGFYLVTFGEKLEEVRFSALDTFGGSYFEFDVGGKSADEANKMLRAGIQEAKVAGRVVVVRVQGELSGGRVADVDFGGLKRMLDERGSLFVYMNRHGVRSRDLLGGQVVAEDIPSIEGKMFRAGVARLKVSRGRLAGESGSKTAAELLRLLRQAAKTNELKREYRQRMVADGAAVIGLDETPEGS